MKGICTCGSDLWYWELKDNELILVCSKCGKKAHWTIMFPMIDLLSQVAEEKDARNTT